MIFYLAFFLLLTSSINSNSIYKHEQLLDSLKKVLKNDIKNEVACEICKETIENVIVMAHNNTSINEIEEYIINRCIDKNTQIKSICEGLAKSFTNEGVFVLRQTNYTANQICGAFVKDCGETDDPLNDMWKFNIPGNKPPVKGWPKVKNPQNTLRVLHLTDIHIDHEYKPGSEANCMTRNDNERIVCCRNYPSINNNNIKVPAGYWGSPYDCDIPYRTFINAIEYISKNDKFDYIIVTGDMESHDMWAYTKTKTMTNILNITLILQEYFPHTPIYQTTGNHEGVPMDAMGPHSMDEYQIRGPTWLYNTFAQAWKRDLPKDTQDGIKYRGSYVIKPYSGLKIISINTVYCSKNNLYNYINQKDPDNTMEWLVNELLESEKINEKVHIISHIPPGTTYCLKGWSFNFYNVVYRFENAITALIYGHTHKDSFQIYYENADINGRPYHVNFVAPSLTTYPYNNPAYRIYTIDGNYNESSFTILESETYYANVTEADENNPPKWKLEYKLKEQFEMEDLSPESFNKLTKILENNTTIFKKFYLYYNRNHKSCKTKCHKNVICNLRSARSYDKTTFCKQ